MEIEWGNFYFQCEKTAALIIAMTPVALIIQLPSVARSVNRLIERVLQTKVGKSLAARVSAAEESEQE